MKLIVFSTILTSLLPTLVYCERRIIVGSLASVGQFPYQVMLEYNGKGMCTGSIIDDSWVITAAHCVVFRGSRPDNYTVRAGFVKKSLGEGQAIKAARIIIHSDYGYSTQPGKHDLALVKVEQPFKFNANVGKIGLSNDPWPGKGGRSCTIAGFGETEKKKSKKLRYLNVKVFHGKKSCPCVVKNRQLKRLVCLAPKSGEGACYGDSGGGIICDGKVVGVGHMIKDKRCKYFREYISDGLIDCGSENVYGLYMYVCPYLDWIKQYVPSAPATPESCHGNIITSSVANLFLCLCIIKIGCF
ncbi:hypothetical protein LSTR_LSTR004795 [Laodelphax striatellus]|uniref:Peptidase S1 domain-containing protein n=1 Tax=Laodelphax striatellus TaxID=195883 RepID=A0A482XJX8_LAOST|nr:hypothetical protein LSTR_LSTR004795 [Laodelphax striatellus]